MIWTEQNLTPGSWICHRFGPLTILLLNLNDEWRICHWLGNRPEVEPGEGKADELPPNLDWQRWDCTEDDLRFQFTPTFPDLPLMAQPGSTLWLVPNGRAQFFVGVPAMIEIKASFDGKMRTMTGIPTQHLTKTWHGDRSAGNPCYTLRTRARRKFDIGEWPENDIVCAIDIVNMGEEDFKFEKLYFESGHLGIFQGDGQLWSNACRIRIRSNNQSTHDVTFAPRPLSPADQAAELKPPVDGRSRKGTFNRAFSSFIDALTD